MTTAREGPATVLVVDDDRDIRETLKDILEEAGYQVHTASDGAAALEALSRLPRPRLILLDMMMPILDGRGFLERSRAAGLLAGIPVVILSAQHATELPPGASAWVKKPMDLDTLLAAVARYGGAAP
jgi:CheY-like chemotaxis protein